MQTELSWGMREGVIAGAAGGFAGSWLSAIGIIVSAQLSAGSGTNEFFQSVLLGFVIGFVGMFIGTPIGALIGVVVGGLYGMLRIDRSAPFVTAALMAGALPVAALLTAGGSSTGSESGTLAEWMFGLMIVGVLGGLGYVAGLIWRNGMRSRRSVVPTMDVSTMNTVTTLAAVAD